MELSFLLISRTENKLARCLARKAQDDCLEEHLAQEFEKDEIEEMDKKKVHK